LAWTAVVVAAVAVHIVDACDLRIAGQILGRLAEGFDVAHTAGDLVRVLRFDRRAEPLRGRTRTRFARLLLDAFRRLSSLLRVSSSQAPTSTSPTTASTMTLTRA
jgi:hypothetical protein